MASRFVQTSDFETGVLKISKTNFQSGDLQSIIESQEEVILIELLGVDLYDAFITDWNADPVGSIEQRFKDIYNPFTQDYGGCIVVSEGIKKMLMYFIYFEYLRFQDSQNRTTGMKKTESENSKRIAVQHSGLFYKYNLGIKTFDSIQWLINQDLSNYPEYNGQAKEVMSWLS